MNGFQEYPKRMSHPQYAAAVFEQLQGKGVGLFAPDTVMRSPERFPEVTVHTKEQEQMYLARGYRPNNAADAAAYELALLEGKPVSGYANNAYPKWKYHPLEIPVTVADKVAEDALGEGWYDSPIEATDDDLEDDIVDQHVVAKSQEVEQVEKPAAKKAPAKKVAKKKPKATAKGKTVRASKTAHA